MTFSLANSQFRGDSLAKSQLGGEKTVRGAIMKAKSAPQLEHFRLRVQLKYPIILFWKYMMLDKAQQIA